MTIVGIPHTRQTSPQSSLLEFAVLREPGQILQASRDLADRGLVDPPTRGGPVQRIVRRWRREPDPTLVAKTWDVQRAVEALSARLDPSDPVLDMGCFACDVLPALKRLGFQSLYGIDLNHAIRQMPYAESIHYTVGDLLSTPWPSGHFAAITAISVIEHGVDDELLCREVSRLLRPGGVFIFTTDYWPEKIATTERMFGLDWRIFDAAEIARLAEVARSHSLHPALHPDASIREVTTPAIHFSGKDYTFLYGAFIRGADEARVAPVQRP
jgi:SAM-dependent methyltransferase